MKKKFISLHALVAPTFSAACFFASFVSYGQEILYGMTQNGGANNKGVPYQINTDGSGFQSYTNFDGDNGKHPGNGARFTQLIDKRFELTGFTIRGLVGLTEFGGEYEDGGNRIQIRPGQLALSTLSNFSLSANYTGINPSGGFFASPEGTLYALTSQGGQDGGGTLFSVPDIFGNGTAVLGFFNGNNGRSPKGTLVRGSDGKLYGTTEFGGTNDLGVIFSYDNTGPNWNLKKLFDFDGSTRGSNPTGNLLLTSDGRLYGMTKNGGANGSGVIFSIQQDGSGYTKLLDLNGPTTGEHPHGSLVLFTDGKLYGMTSAGGMYGYGTIFSITSTGTFMKIHDFNGSNGKSPVGDLLVDISGTTMYGTTYSGGVNDQGVLFKLQNGTQFTKLYDYSVATGSNPVGALTMMREEADIKIQPIPDKTTVSAPFVPAIETAVDMPVYFISRDTSVVAVKNNMLVVRGVGSSEITAIQLGNHAYLSVAASTYVNVKRAPQKITFGTLPAKTFGDAPFTISATSTSGLPVSFFTTNSAVATVEGDKVTIQGGGHVSIGTYQNGDSKYEEATQVTQHLFVERADQTITFQAMPSRYCCQSFDVLATSSSHLAVLLKSSDRTKIDVSFNTAVPRGIGSAEITAYHPGDNNYKPAAVTMPVEILKGDQYIIFNVPGIARRVGDLPEYLGTGSTGGLPVTYTSNPPGIAVVEKGMLYFLAAGTTTITATQSGNELYHPATPVSRAFTVNAPTSPGAGNTITFPDLSPATMADPPFNLTGYATSGLPVTYTSSNPSVAEINGNLVTIKSVGATTITASQPGKTGIPAAAPVSSVLQVTKKDHYILSPNMTSVSFGVQPIPLTMLTTAGLPITYTLSDNTLASIENYYLHIKDAGTLIITASHPGNNHYNPAPPVNTEIEIYPDYDYIFFKDLGELTYGDGPIDLEAWTSSGLPVTFSSDAPNIASISGSKLTIHATGFVTLSASSINPGYSPNPTVQYLVIKKAKQAITFPPVGNKTFGSPPFIISTSSTSNLPASLSTTTPGVVRIDGNVVTVVGSGTAEIIASHPGNDNYEPAPAVHQKFLVTDAGRTYNMVGATSNGGPNSTGLVFSMDSEGQGFEIIKDYGAIAPSYPQGGFIKGTDGKMYGVFSKGGTGNAGAIVRVEADGTGLTTIHNFKSPNGAYPTGNLIQATNGDLYGVTDHSGLFDGGTIYKIRTDGTGFTVLKHLGPSTGRLPNGGLKQGTNGKLYGMTTAGGVNGIGTIFSMNPDGSAFTVIFHLNDLSPAKTGYTPTGDLSQGPDGFLYGTTTQGGTYGDGTLFKIRPDGTDFSKLINFNRIVTGSVPAAGLLFASDGKIYGMTGSGGANNFGAIFSINANGTNFTYVFSFDGGNNGSFPKGKLMEGSDGALYGMTYMGGVNAIGTIFKINKNGTGFHKMANLDESAKYPVYGPLLESTPGNFFGMTSQGGPVNGGAVFKINSLDVFTIINNVQEESSMPRNLIEDPSGEYYFGVTGAKYPNDGGSIFRLSASGSSYEQIYVVPKGDIITSIFYVSTDHIWVSGIHDNENFMFRIRPDGSELQQITAYNAALAQERKPAITMVETPDGEIFGGTDGYWSTPIFFKIKNDGTGFSKLFDLNPSDRIGGNLLRGSDGNFYMAYAHEGIYKFTPSGMVTKIFSHPPEAHGPTVNKIIEMNGGRIGIVTSVNGSGSNGSIFSIEKDGTGYSIIYQPRLRDGTWPVDMIQSVDGWLYVASESGGTHQKGVIYKVRPDGSSFKKMREFDGDDGETPNRIFFKRELQSFTFDVMTEKKVSDLPFFPPVTSSSGALVELSSSNPSVAIIENGLIKPVGIGSTTIAANLPANANYSAGGEIERTLVVVKGDQSITFETLPEKIIGDEPFELSAVSSVGLPVIFQSSNPTVASISGTTVTIHKVGTTTITASNPGDANFFPATTSQVLLINNGGPQTIAFSNPGTKVLGAGPFPLSATSSSGLPVVYTTTTSDKISLNGAQVTILKAGRVTIHASQDGDSYFDPAIPMEVTFCVNPPKPLIAESGIAPDLEFRSSNDVGNQWYFNDEIIEAYTSKSILVYAEGSYTVQTTVDGCASEFSSPKAFVTTGIEEMTSVNINVYPNPAKGDVNVEIGASFSGVATIELLDGIGRSLDVREITKPDTIVFDLAEGASGILMVKITLNGKTIVRKIFKS